VSISRKVELNIDLQEIEATARDLGLDIQYNKPVKGYGSNIVENADLLIGQKKGNSYMIGFKKEGDKIVMAYDDSFTKSLFSQLMPAYYERVIQNKLRGRGFKVDRRSETSQAITIYLKRGA